MRSENKKKLLNFIAILSAILSLIWFILKPGFEPASCLLLSIGSLISIYVIENKNKSKNETNNYIYSIMIRGYNELELKKFVHNLSNTYFGISNYYFEMIDGEWYNVIVNSIICIKQDELFFKCKEITKNDGVKIYEVSGEGKTFGLLNGEWPPQYL